jgi:hypothetical protein
MRSPFAVDNSEHEDAAGHNAEGLIEGVLVCVAALASLDVVGELVGGVGSAYASVISYFMDSIEKAIKIYSDYDALEMASGREFINLFKNTLTLDAPRSPSPHSPRGDNRDLWRLPVKLHSEWAAAFAWIVANRPGLRGSKPHRWVRSGRSHEVGFERLLNRPARDLPWQLLALRCVMLTCHGIELLRAAQELGVLAEGHPVLPLRLLGAMFQGILKKLMS